MSVVDLVRESTLSDPAGLDLLSYLISDPLFVYQRIASGVTFTMGGPPSVLAAFGMLPGMIVLRSCARSCTRWSRDSLSTIFTEDTS